MGQSWVDVLFAHWPVPPETLRPAVPAAVPVDTFDGSAWIGITPFEVIGARPRGAPPVPWLSRFPELNVRTYATVDGRPGIWFLSLDAARLPIVLGARRAYRLPYHHARMSVTRRGGRVTYRSESLSPRRPRAALELDYAPVAAPVPPVRGTLEHFLTERYTLWTIDAAHRLHAADIHHAPWPLQRADADLRENTMTAPYGLALPRVDPLLHYAARQDVVVWPPRRAG
ncbi:MAG TPA: DUF2071 domain-containing protein [Solirubrobacteraceae bacterium]|nr:DUF2071 domain-containing protein [Solirubrobacteraceae bacterium]